MTQPLETLHAGTTPPLQPELVPLLRLLSRAKGFALAFLKSNAPTERERLIEVLSQSLRERGCSGRVLHLRKPVANLLKELRELTPPLASGDALFVIGFEQSIPAEVDFPPALVQLNMARELYRNLPCPLVIVLPDYALTQLARQAPDFWAWRSGVFEAVEQEEEGVTMVQRMTISRDRGALGLSRKRVEGNLEVLQELFEGYIGRVGVDRLQAALLTEIANDLALLGEFEEAHAAGKQALEIAQRLRALSLEASALGSLTVSLMNLGRAGEALDLGQRAVEVNRELVLNEETQTAQRDLAISLNTLSVVLSSFGRSDEALQVNREAVALLRALPPEHAAEFLAMALENRGVMLRDLGRQEDALAFMKEALEIRRRLASESSDIYLPALASSLNNLSAMLIDLDRKAEALQAIQEAAKISRDVLPHRPDSEIPGLASNLFNLGVVLRGLGRNEEAVAAMEEGIRWLAPFVSRRPAVFKERTVGQAKRYSALCAEMGRKPDPELLGLLES